MTGKIISGVTYDVILATGDNPVSILAAATVTGTNDAIYGPASANWTIDNQGTVTGTGNVGIHLLNGGTIANHSAGLITGAAYGIYILGDRGTVINSGSISQSSSGGRAVKLIAGGLVNNNAATASIVGTDFGVYIAGQVGSVTNSGSISGNRYSVYLQSGGIISNAASGMIGGTAKITGPSGTVANLGTIDAPTTFGVYLSNGGTITNGKGGPSSALIHSYNGLAFTGSQYAGRVTNYGSIVATGTGSTAIGLANGGTVVNGPSNAMGAFIQGGRWGVYGGQGANITNFGTIVSTGSGATDAGVFIQNLPGNISNLGSTALIDGYYGVVIAASGTLTNAGTIASTRLGGVAAQFSSGGRLVVDPGAVFVGTVTGGSGIMELAGTASGTIGALGTYFTGFDTVAVDAGANWNITGDSAVPGIGVTIAIAPSAKLAVGGSLTGAVTFALTGGTLDLGSAVYSAVAFNFNTAGSLADLLTLETVSGSSFDSAIANFGIKDKIALPNLALLAGSTVSGSGSTLTVPLANGIDTFTFSNFGFQAGAPQEVIVGANSITEACFAAGTRVSTERGLVRVDDIRRGDRLHVLVGNASQPVIWIGRRTIDCARHPRPHRIWPVRVAAGAFGSARPGRDLWLSPNHALFVDGVLIPVKFLINGTSIAQVAVAEVSYFHLELPQHDVLLAEGLPAESYLDMGDRANYGDAAVIRLYPDFAERWDAGGCAPLIVAGPVLVAARRSINALAGMATAA